MSTNKLHFEMHIAGIAGTGFVSLQTGHHRSGVPDYGLLQRQQTDMAGARVQPCFRRGPPPPFQ